MADELASLYTNTALSNTKQTVTTAKNKRLVAVSLANQAAAATYIQFYDALAADVTVGTTAPTFVIGLAASATLVALCGPVSFATGIVVAATTSPTNSTAPGTAAVVCLSYL